MAIAYANGGTASAGFASSLTFAFDVGAGSDRFLIVLAGTDRGSATTISSATYAGVSMSAQAGTTSAASGYDYRLFYLANPTSGSNNVVITYSDGNAQPKAVAAVYTGVDQTTPASGFTNASAYNASPTWTVTSAIGETVVAISFNYGRTAVTAASPATERLDAQCGATSWYAFVFDEDGASSVTINGSATGGSTEWYGVGMSLLAASGGGGFQPAWAINANAVIQSGVPAA